MRITFNKALLMGGYLLMTVAVAGAFTACSDDDDEELTAIQSPTLEKTGSSVSSLSFSWTKVANATQYFYELTDPDGNTIDGDVIVGNTASFTGLKDNTTYTLSVWAYSAVANGVYGDAPVAVMTATTDAIVPLPAPTNLKVRSHTGTRFSLQWDNVQYASSYEYLVTQGEEEIASGSTNRNSVNVNVPGKGDYVLSVYAVSGNEAYSDSEAANFSFSKEAEESWRMEGQMSGGGYKWTATLVAYDDDTYSLTGWYGYEGYDLNFSVDATSKELVLSGYTEGNGYYYVPTSEGYGSWVYPGGGFSNFVGTKTSGKLYIWDNYLNDYATFVWPTPLEVSLIDQLVGTYSEVTSGGDYFTSDWSWQNASYTQDAVTVTKVDDTTLLMTGFYDGTSSLTLTVDQTAGTVKIASGQTIAGYYTLAQYYSSANHPDEAIEVGYDLETGKLTIPKDGDYSSWKCWTTYYASQYYSYGFYVSTLTKK